MFGYTGVRVNGYVFPCYLGIYSSNPALSLGQVGLHDGEQPLNPYTHLHRQGIACTVLYTVVYSEEGKKGIVKSDENLQCNSEEG